MSGRLFCSLFLLLVPLLICSVVGVPLSADTLGFVFVSPASREGEVDEAKEIFFGSRRKCVRVCPTFWSFYESILRAKRTSTQVNDDALPMVVALAAAVLCNGYPSVLLGYYWKATTSKCIAFQVKDHNSNDRCSLATIPCCKIILLRPILSPGR